MEHHTLSFDTVLHYSGSKNKPGVDWSLSFMNVGQRWAKQSENWTEAPSTNAYLQLRRQLPTKLRRFINILIATQS